MQNSSLDIYGGGGDPYDNVNNSYMKNNQPSPNNGGLQRQGTEKGLNQAPPGAFAGGF